MKVVFTVGWSREKGDLQGPLQREEEDAGAPHGSQAVLGGSWKGVRNRWSGAMRPGKAQAALLLRPGPALTSSWVTGDASPSGWWLAGVLGCSGGEMK